MSAVCNVINAHQSTRLLASTTLRNTLGTKTLQAPYFFTSKFWTWLFFPLRIFSLTEKTLPGPSLGLLILLPTPGASGERVVSKFGESFCSELRESKWKMSACQSNSRGPWQLRLRHQDMPGLGWGISIKFSFLFCTINTIYKESSS